MEKLLNKRIEEWWKPFKIKSDNICLYCLKDNKIVISYYDFDTEWECNHYTMVNEQRKNKSIWIREYCYGVV